MPLFLISLPTIHSQINESLQGNNAVLVTTVTTTGTFREKTYQELGLSSFRKKNGYMSILQNIFDENVLECLQLSSF